jgi:four helix bundle protein
MDEEILNRNRNINRGYRKLQVWLEAIELAAFVRDILKKKDTIPFKVRAQIQDSILSVPSNIAEGYSRRSLKEYIRHLNISLSSLSENYSQFFVLLESGDIKKEVFDDYDSKHYKLENKLLKLIESLINKLKNQNDWEQDYLVKENEIQYLKSDD